MPQKHQKKSKIKPPAQASLSLFPVTLDAALRGVVPALGASCVDHEEASDEERTRIAGEMAKLTARIEAEGLSPRLALLERLLRCLPTRTLRLQHAAQLEPLLARLQALLPGPVSEEALRAQLHA